MFAINRRGFCATLLATPLAGAFGGAVAAAAPAATAPSRYPGIIGTQLTYRTTREDTLIDLARTFRLGYTDIVIANPDVDPWLPGAGVDIVLPTSHILPDAPREGLVLNLSDQRLYFFREDGVTVDTAPLGVGDQGWATPQGSTTVVRKKANPTWYVPKSVRKEQPELPAIVRPGPANPLGSHALYLGWPAYLIHGTNKPYGVGRRVSHGCVRLYPEDIARLYKDVKVGTRVTVVDQDLKIARVGDELWIEVHPNVKQAVEVERDGEITPAKPAEFEFRIATAAGKDQHRVDWELAREAALERRGIPVQLLKPVEHIKQTASPAD